MLKLYRKPILSLSEKSELLRYLKEVITADVKDIDSEYCFYIQCSAAMTEKEMHILFWLISETFEQEYFENQSFLSGNTALFEVGPRLNFTTSWSSNAVSICHSCGLEKIVRIERSRRYSIQIAESLNNQQRQLFLDKIHDRMTECPYQEPLTNFKIPIKPETKFDVLLLEKGKKALEKLNREMGFGFDQRDLDFYYDLFVNKIGRNPTNVECFDLAQSNSEHSRHWFFTGKLFVDGRKVPNTLLELVQDPLKNNKANSLIAFSDNSSAIKGYRIRTILADNPELPSVFHEKSVHYHIIFTAETHNFPSGVAPFPGAETGTGGRIRDIQAAGRGGIVVAGTAAYCVGNLNIPGYGLPWEEEILHYPNKLASPLQIEIDASNGASDYGNKFGEPLIQGFTRSFGLITTDGQRWEWIKPIMFTGGVGQLDDGHQEKGKPEKGMLIVKVGGPAYRIGMGGGAASSMIQGENPEELDFNAVQRGDAEMEQKMNRVVRACIEMGDKNPIVTIHDQGAGGNCNVIKELIYPEGGRIEIRNILVGDSSLSVLEIWGAEYQENNAILLRKAHVSLFQKICEREKVPFSIIGTITGDGRIVVHDNLDKTEPVNLDLSFVLGDMPQKKFHLQRLPLRLEPLFLPKALTVQEALNRVLRLLQVGSKRFLTNKVDRSVTGLIARQQCVGPLHLTLSDVAVIAQSHFELSGCAISIGEQPIKTLIHPAAMARLAVAEALTNLVWAKVSSLEDVKCSANWMWAPKLPGEGIKLYEALLAMSDMMEKLGIAVDGGKDSLSMAATFKTPSGTMETVKSPGTLVISAYTTCPDITRVITPDIKEAGNSRLLYIDLGAGKKRMGGSALAQVFKQLGNESPDIDDIDLLRRTFNTVQGFIDKELILSGHDISDGGLITTLLEMAFAGDCGFNVKLTSEVYDMDSQVQTKGKHTALEYLFAEEMGVIFEYTPNHEAEILEILNNEKIPAQSIGETSVDRYVTVTLNDQTVLNEEMNRLRALWEETSFRIERLQANPDCVRQEHLNAYRQKPPVYQMTFSPEQQDKGMISAGNKPAVAVIREEGSNGDREMASAFYMAGFEPWDVTMTDLLKEKIDVNQFQGIAFVGGFSYGDVLDSAKGWAGVIRFNKNLWEQFHTFYQRSDTFSLGVCNGCQLMALLGWVPWPEEENNKQPRFVRNDSHRFESRFSTVTILPSPSMMLKEMAGSTLGIWIAHGEGKVFFPEKESLHKVMENALAPIRYVDDKGDITTAYPFNPNGSPFGIAALCSPDGRHLAMMPHPERTFLKWQWPWIPESMKKGSAASPWMKMFQNAKEWCEHEK